MSKDNKKREFKIPKEVKNFLMPFKKWKKDNDFYESKKDARKAYYTEKLEWMGESVIPLLVSYGYRQEVIEIKNDLYEGLSDPEFVKVATEPALPVPQPYPEPGLHTEPGSQNRRPS